jgi:diacylglycerol diphosphate phosphatase / phosphatidate phosphatase
MPSGHSTAAFAGLIFLALYFNAQLKVVSAHCPAYWKFVITLAPVLGACLIAGALTIDECESTAMLARVIATEN